MEQRIRKALASTFNDDVAARARLDNLGGHASLRIYWRVHLPASFDQRPRDESTLIAMVLPEGFDPARSEEGKPQPERVDGAPVELDFVHVHRYLDALHLPVPEIDSVSMDLGVLLLEDLGDISFEELYLAIERDFGPDPGQRRLPIERLYHRAINLLVDIQRTVKQHHYDTSTEAKNLPETAATQRGFDRDLLRWELDHYLEYGLIAQHPDQEIPPEAKQEFDTWFDAIVTELAEAPTTLVMRDYQSRNLMDKDGKLVLIDFQDALIGPMIYDLVALLRDSYIELPYVTVHRLVEYYINQGVAAGLGWCDDPDTVWRTFHLQTLQRKLKDAGRFVFIDQVKNNSSFLQYYPSSIAYVRQALEMLPDLAPFADLIAEFDPAWDPEDA